MQRNNKCKSTQKNLSKSEIPGSYSTGCEKQPPAKITSYVKVLLKADSGCQMCEICSEITKYTIVEIERKRDVGNYAECISRHLHVLCDVCLASILGHSSGKSDTLKPSTGRVTPCSNNACEISSNKTVAVKDDQSNTCRVSCNMKTHTKVSSVISKDRRQDKPEKPYEISFVKSSEKSNTVSNTLSRQTSTKTHETSCGPDCRNDIKSQEKMETIILKPKCSTVDGETRYNKKNKINQKGSQVTDMYVMSVPEKRNYTSSAQGCKILPEIPPDTRNTTGCSQHSPLQDFQGTSCFKCEDSKILPVMTSNPIHKENNRNNSKEDKEQSLVNCGTCYPSVQESVKTVELLRIECVEPDKIKYENCFDSNNEDNETSISAIGSVSCDQVKEKTDANESELKDKQQSLMVCANCEPCYSSVQESISIMGLHCVECAGPDKIKCENCLDRNNDDNKASSYAIAYASSDQIEERIEANETELRDKGQSPMICETCEPCYPSVQEHIAAMEQHCVECAEPFKIECENCLTGNYKANNSSPGSETAFQMSKVLVERQISPNGYQYTSCCECEDDNKIAVTSGQMKGENYANVPEVMDKELSLIICVPCEPCHPSPQKSIVASIAARELYCVECSDPEEIKCESCLNRTDENNKLFSSCAITSQISSVPVEKKISSKGCQYTPSCECEDEKIAPAVACDQVNEENDSNSLGVMDRVQSLMICETCEPCYPSLEESVAAMEFHCAECAEPDKIECESCLNDKLSPNYANLSTKISYAQSNKQIQCQYSELQSINGCGYDNDHDAEIMNNAHFSTVCLHCKQSIIDKKSSNKIHYPECSSTNEILCESCLKITSKHDDLIMDVKANSTVKCAKSIDKKCAPMDCRTFEEKSYDTKPKTSELQSEMYCKTWEQCKDNFSQISEITHGTICADISKIKCASCLEIVNKQSNRIIENKLDAKLIYELVCETCKQLSGDTNCLEKEYRSIERDNETSYSCVCKIEDGEETMIYEKNLSDQINCMVCSTCRNLIEGHSRFENKRCIECANAEKIQCGVCSDKMNKKESQIAKSKCNESSNANPCRDKSCTEGDGPKYGLKIKSRSDPENCGTIFDKRSPTTKSSTVNCSTCADCNETNCGDCEANKKIIDKYFGQKHSKKIQTESTVSKAKFSVDSLNCTEKNCSNYGQIIKETCQNDSYSKESGQRKEHCLDCIDINNILCESCLKLTNEQNRFDARSDMLAGTKNQSSPKSQQSNNYLIFDVLFKENSSQNKHEENCTCCICTDKKLREQNVRNVNAKAEIPIEKYSANAENVSCDCSKEDLALTQHKVEETLSYNCSVCAGLKDHHIEKHRSAINKQIPSKSYRSPTAPTYPGTSSELQDEPSTKGQRVPYSTIQEWQEQVTKCCYEPECVKCGQSKNMTKLYEVISLSISESVSDTSTGQYTSHSFVEAELASANCSTKNIIEFNGVLLSEPCEGPIDEKTSESKPKCSCHIGTNTSKPLSNNGSVHVKKSADRYELKKESSIECSKCHGFELIQHKKVGNSLKGECGTALKYKLCGDDRASDYVLLDGPVFIKKSCVGGKYKVIKSTSGTPVGDVGDSSAHASRIQAAQPFQQCRECCRDPGCVMPELKQLCVLEPEIITEYERLYLPNKLPRQQEEDDFDPTVEYVPYLVHTHGNPPPEEKYHFLMLDVECCVQSKDIINKSSEITVDLELLEKQISRPSEEKPHSILVKEVTRDDEDYKSDTSMHKDKIIINWDPEVEITEKRLSSLGSDKRRVSLTPRTSEVGWREEDNPITPGEDADDPMISLASRKPRHSLLKDTVLDRVVREHKRRESLLPVTLEPQPLPPVTPPVPQKRKFSLSLFKKDKRKKKFSKTSSDIVKSKHEDSDSESSMNSSREDGKSSSTKSK